MSTIEAYDIKARKKVSMKNPQPYLMKNGTWALKGISAETGIKLGNTPLVGRRFYKHFAKHLKEILISVIESKLYLLEIEMKVLF